MGALRPPNPPTAERGGADFGLCHNALRPFFQQLMSAMVRKNSSRGECVDDSFINIFPRWQAHLRYERRNFVAVLCVLSFPILSYVDHCNKDHPL